MSSLVIAILALSLGADERKVNPMSDVITGDNRFAVDLYGRLGHEPGNLFFSPFGISNALAMTHDGARGETAEQIARVLRLDQAPAIPRRILAPLDMGGPDRGVRLSVANRLWGKDGSRFRPEFLDLARARYGADLARVDFARPEAACQQINDWVERRTRGKIRDLIRPGDLDATTRLVLTNAIYFKGDWTSPFDKAATREAPFHLTSNEEVRVPMMHRKADFRFFEGDGLKALESPYGEGDLAMDILLPDRAEGLRDLEGRLSAENLTRWLGGLQRREVDLSLPRFSMSSRFDLAAILGAMGMMLAFTPGRADFSGISTEGQLAITGVIHQAFVDVNEEGTEAAAATAGVMHATAVMMPKPPAVFHADHPFLYLIRDTRSASILFIGRLANPAG